MGKEMKILHLCSSDLNGGAARAAYRLHQAQRKFGLDSHMLVIDKASDDPFVHSLSRVRTARAIVANALRKDIVKYQNTQNPTLHSLNVFPSGIIKYINKIQPDVVNLHWLGGEMLSIAEIGKIKQPIVWTMHDMWAFCGAEHYEDPEHEGRYMSDYSAENRNAKHTGWDLDSWCYQRKKKHWSKQKFHVVTPSTWLERCVKKSALFSHQPIMTISNCIDHSLYRPLDKDSARKLLGLPLDKKLVLFGAMSSTSDPRKGYHYLQQALLHLKVERNADNIELVVFGASGGSSAEDTGLITHYLGRLHDDFTLSALYNAADVFVAPSLQDNLSNTLVESLACGTPCVAFDIGGMSDLIPSNDYGTLVPSIDKVALAVAIRTELARPRCSEKIAQRSMAMRSENHIASQYSELYKCILKQDYVTLT
jgi:glycosyltransferase involved in cell wall biosynthesis